MTESRKLCPCRKRRGTVTMETLPSVIPTAIIHIINTLDSDSEHRSRYSSKANFASFFSGYRKTKNENRTNFSLLIIPVKRKPGERKHISPSKLRRQRARKQRFREKKSAEKVDCLRSEHTRPSRTGAYLCNFYQGQLLPG